MLEYSLHAERRQRRPILRTTPGSVAAGIANGTPRVVPATRFEIPAICCMVSVYGMVIGAAACAPPYWSGFAACVGRPGRKGLR
jgi:hypothetical protein